MKKIVQFGLCALMAIAFVDVSATSKSLKYSSSRRPVSTRQAPELVKSLPLIVKAYDNVLSSSVAKCERSILSPLCKFVEKVKDCSKKEIEQAVYSVFDRVLREMHPSRNRGMCTRWKMKKTRDEWGRLFGALKDLIVAVKWLYGEPIEHSGYTDFCTVDECLPYVNAIAILKASGKQTNVPFRKVRGFDLKPAKFPLDDKSEQDYIRRVQCLNILHNAGVIGTVSMYLDENLSELLSSNLDLEFPYKDTTMFREEFWFFGEGAEPLDIASIPFYRMGKGIKLDEVRFRNCKITDVLWDFLDAHAEMRGLFFENVVDATSVCGDVNFGRLLKTSINEFAYDNIESSEAARLWLASLPKDVLYLYLGFDNAVAFDSRLELFRNALKRFPRIMTLDIELDGPQGANLDLKTIAYMAVHPTFIESNLYGDNLCGDNLCDNGAIGVSYDFSGRSRSGIDSGIESALNAAIKNAGIDPKPEPLVNVMMAFALYSRGPVEGAMNIQVLNDPYENVDLLMLILRSVIDFRNRLRATGKGEDNVIFACYIDATREFRNIVEAKYDDFKTRSDQLGEKALQEDDIKINDEFGQLILEAHEVLKSSLQSVLSNATKERQSERESPLLLTTESENDSELPPLVDFSDDWNGQEERYTVPEPDWNPDLIETYPNFGQNP